VATTAIVIAGAAIGVRQETTTTPDPPPVGDGLANVWVDADGGTCTRSSTAIAYSTATACATPQSACSAATGGDVVEMQPGTYQPALQRWITSDCSDGLGSDVNWNTAPYADLSRATNWVTFRCSGGRNAVKSHLGGFTIKGNAHVIFDGGEDKCFYFRGSVQMGEGGDTTQTTRNIVLYRVHQMGIRMWGAQNTLILDSEIGPSMVCGKFNDPNVDVEMQCDPNGPEWEAQYANYGTTTTACPAFNAGGNGTACGGSSNMIAFEPIIGINTGNFGSSGSRMEGNWIHDQQIRDTVKWHPGCLLVFGAPAGQAANSFVFTRNICERIAVQQVQLEIADGTTISNNFLGVPTYGYQEAPGGTYAEEATGQISLKLQTDNAGPSAWWSPQNVTVAYNTMAGGGHIPWSNPSNPITFTNVKFIGNLTLGTTGSTCTATGASGGSPVTYTGNYGVGCTAITGGTSNVVDPGQGTVLCDETTLPTCQKLDLHLTGAAKAWEDAVAVSAGGLDDNVDYDDATRASPRTAGADER
jgi:hypothetical protein